jgi:hypothetical protein
MHAASPAAAPCSTAAAASAYSPLSKCLMPRARGVSCARVAGTSRTLQKSASMVEQKKA